MDKLDEYRLKVQQLLEKYAQCKPSYGDVEVEIIFDTQRVGSCPPPWGIATKLSISVGSNKRGYIVLLCI